MLQKTSIGKIGTREIAASSLLGALSALWEIIPGPPFDIRFPLYPRISWDITGIPMMIALFLYGPLCAVYTCFIGCSIIFFRGNIPGGTLKLLAELATIIGYALFKRNFVVDTAKATLSRVLVMTVANYYLLQFFYGMSSNVVAGLLLPIAVFNVTQALINIIPSYIVYRRIKQLQKA
ncbi:MAG: ECF transporter S component [Candidatus Bathycorpusculaceae bacterium]